MFLYKVLFTCKQTKIKCNYCNILDVSILGVCHIVLCGLPKYLTQESSHKSLILAKPFKLELE